MEELLAAADEVWWSLSESDWLEAFGAHPKIGESQTARAQDAQARDWSEAEQAGARDAAHATLAELAAANRIYEAKFGYIFIVCATGKTAAGMLASLHARLSNAAGVELRLAAAEQGKITKLRLEKLLGGSVSSHKLQAASQKRLRLHLQASGFETSRLWS